MHSKKEIPPFSLVVDQVIFSHSVLFFPQTTLAITINASKDESVPIPTRTPFLLRLVSRRITSRHTIPYHTVACATTGLFPFVPLSPSLRFPLLVLVITPILVPQQPKPHTRTYIRRTTCSTIGSTHTHTHCFAPAGGETEKTVTMLPLRLPFDVCVWAPGEWIFSEWRG